MIAPRSGRGPEAPAAWHAVPPEAVAAAFGVDPRRGLSAAEVEARRAAYGPNVTGVRRAEPWWEPLFEALREPLQLLLVAVGIAYLAFGAWADAATILAVVLAVAGIEAANERRARGAVAALSALAAPVARVVRDGAPAAIPAPALVPGDVVLLGPGERVPADVRLLDAVALRVDESSLTGEAIPAAKRADVALPAATELGDRCTLAHAGTLVVAGRGRGVVVAVGAATEEGRIARLAALAREPRTPLQRAMAELSRLLLWVAIGFAVAIPVAGVWIAGRPVREMVLTGLALAFATIPEELPILVTLVLGVGSYRLARRHAIVKHLRAAETLGAVSVVATDKTGTLTAQRLRAVELVAGRERCAPADAARTSAGRALLEALALANDASIVEDGSGWTASGDPTAVALFDAARDARVDVPALRRSTRVLREVPFDHRRQRASAVVEDAAGRRLVVAGAPEEVLGRCARIRGGEGDRPLDDAARAAIGAEVDARAVGGLRVLAAAERRLGPDDAGDRERELSWLGIVALDDPPRPGAAEAVAALRRAGVRVLMVTGDHPATAAAVATRVGIDASRVVRGRELDALAAPELAGCLVAASVFARIAPEHKLRIVGALQDGGAAVAVTGDGVNDAPALRAAAVGVAMGRTGTQVAREAADLVLADDDFATVVEAVRTGRVLFGNLRKAVRYYLAAKAALVLASLAAVLTGLPVPFAPVQIVLLELFLDLGASVTFVAEPPEDDVMARPPRDPRARFVDRAMVAGILGGGLSLGGAVLLVYGTAIARGAALAPAQTAAFVTWMIGHVVLAAHMRGERQPLLRTRLLANRAFAAWAVAAAVAVGAAVLVPPVGERLHAAPFDPGLWPLAIGTALLFPSWWEPWKWARLRAGRGSGRPNGASMP